MQTRILTVSAPATHGAVFNFLADIENLPAWTGGLCEMIELHRDGWWAYTALGEFAVETKVDDIARVIDLQWRHVAGWSLVIPMRVSGDGEGGTLIRILCRQPVGMPAEDFEPLFDFLLAGLRGVADRLQPEAAVAG
jgi:hypothetical protein